MTSRYTLPVAMLLLAPGLWSGSARAEGTAETGATQKLQTDASLDGTIDFEMYVDILNQGEEITWSGYSLDPQGAQVPISVEVIDPLGASLGFYPSGSTIPVLLIGAYTVIPQGQDLDGVDGLDRVAEWDLAVTGTAPGYGRVWSDRWKFEGASFAEIDSFNSSLYVIVGGGSATNDAVVELKGDGLVGRFFQITANDIGVFQFPGRSVYYLDGVAVEKYAVYLNPPEIASYNPLTPEISNAFFDPGVCEGVAPFLSEGEITFDSTVDGVLHFVCDIDQDGQFDFTDDDDVHILVNAVVGTNTITWEGNFDTGEPVPPGSYTCQVILTVGEFHYTALDIESSYPGFRLFMVEQDLDRQGLYMYWNDSLVQDTDVLMPPPTNAFGLENTGLDGVFSGDYDDPLGAQPNVNARSWGNFTTVSKGNDSLLDTYTWVADDRALFNVEVLDTVLDSDFDGIVDSVEDCVSLTDPLDPDSDGDGLQDGQEFYDLLSDPLDQDTDGDGLLDGVEAQPLANPPDTDGDGVLNINDPDDDGDTVLTADELPAGDTDGDGDDDYLDTDDDDDGTLTADEVPDGDTDGDGDANYVDTDDDGDLLDSSFESDFGDFDGDGIEDRLDTDDDDDGIPTSVEGTADADGDGTGNWHDTDSDDDGLLDIDEGASDGDGDGDGNFLDLDSDDDSYADFDEGVDDTDGDGNGDFDDPDDDDDGVFTIDEVDGDTDADGNDDRVDDDDDGDLIPTLEEGADDVDTDELPNYLDDDSDGDTVSDLDEGAVDSDDDGTSDFLDTDDDDDTLPTAEEADGDTDGDLEPDRLDDDDDGDGILTADEIADGDALGTTTGSDVDEDGVPNWLDTDSDGDGVDDGTEGRPDTDGDAIPEYLDLSSDVFGWYQGGTGCDSTGSQRGWGVALAPLLLAFLRRRSGAR